MKIIPTAQMSKTTRELSGYAIPRPAAGVMRGALRRRRWEPAGWAGIWRLGTSGLGGARPGEGGQEGGALPLGKTQHGAFPGRQRTGRCPRRCAWHGEGTRAQPVPSHAGLAPQVTLTRKQSPLPRGGPAWRRSREEDRRGRREGRKYGTTQRETTSGREAGGVEPSPPRGRAGARRPHTLTCPSPCPPARPAEAPIRRGPRARARTRTHARPRLLPALALGRLSPSSAHSKPGARSVATAVAAAQPPWPPLPPKSPSPPPAPDPPRSRPTPRPGPASPPRSRPILRLGPAPKAELGAVSRLSLPHPAPGLFWPNKGIGCYSDVQDASQWA